MSDLRNGAKLLAALVAGALLCPGPASAQRDELKDIERALREDRSRAEDLRRQADTLALEIQALRVESISIARRAQDHETRMSEIEERLSELERLESEKSLGLAARHEQMGQTLAALQRIALQPADALLLSPASPLDTVRSGMLLRAALPAIEARAAVLRDELQDLAVLRVRIAAERGDLAKETQALAADRDRLETLIARKTETRAAAAAGQEAAQERAARLAARAEDLRELIERIEREAADLAAREAAERAAREQAAREQAERAAQEQASQEQAAREQAAKSQAPAEPPAAPESRTAELAPGAQVALAQPPNIRPFPTSGQSLVLPARGRVKSHFGQTQGDGRAARGIVIGARSGAQVVAPYDGKVVYAGVFRSYGQILIIEHGGRYHTLLAGLERLDAVVGQWLLAGEPVGVLGLPRGGEPELYLELRHAGQPINPVPWLATTGDKVRG